MKYRLLDLLSCPDCGKFPLNLESFKKENVLFAERIDDIRCAEFCMFEKDGDKKDCNVCYSNEIIDGVLICPECDKCYAIINGVPRFNPDWSVDFPHFVDNYKYKLTKSIIQKLNSQGHQDFKKSHGSTKKSFGFQWLRYEVTDKEEDIEDFYSKTGVSPEFLGDKLILDAGCGMGRFLMVSANENNEVVGIDLSVAVTRAYEITKGHPFIYVIQGNLMKPPLREKTFDFIYSIGVLHHTPSTERAFRSISSLVKNEGRVSIWVYQLWVPPELTAIHKRAFAWIQEIIFNNIRKITTKLPCKILHYICYLAVPLGWLQKEIRKNRLAKLFFWPLLLLVVNNHEKGHIRLLDTFDWYSPKYQWKHTYEEVFYWFRKEGFRETSKTPSHPIGVTAIKN